MQFIETTMFYIHWQLVPFLLTQINLTLLNIRETKIIEIHWDMFIDKTSTYNEKLLSTKWMNLTGINCGFKTCLNWMNIDFDLEALLSREDYGVKNSIINQPGVEII